MENNSFMYSLLNKDKKFNHIPLLIFVGLFLIEAIIQMVLLVVFKNTSTGYVLFISKIVPMIIVIILLRDDFIIDAKSIKEHIKFFLIFTVIAGAIMYLTEFGISLYQEAMYLWFDIGTATNQQTIIDMFDGGIGTYIVMFITLVIIAPILEELEFRVLVFKAFNKSKPFIPILISTILFGLAHIDITGIVEGHVYEVAFIPVYVLPGLALALMYHFSNRNIYPNILVHSIINFISYIGIVATLQV